MIELEDKPETQPLLTVEQVATYLNTETWNVNRWIREGKITGIKVGREWRVEPAELERFVEENKRPKKETDERG